MNTESKMNTKLEQAARQALDALCDFDYDKRLAAIQALQEALECKEVECSNYQCDS